MGYMCGTIILEEAGGSMLDEKNLKLTYNKADLRNPFFIASS